MLNERVFKTLAYWSNVICERVVGKWGKVNIPISNEEHITHTMMIIDNKIIGLIEANGWGAWVKEFGRGSLGDHNHIYWDEYIKSKYFNPTRKTTLFKRTDMARVNGEHSYPIQAWGKDWPERGFPPGFDMEYFYWINKHDERFEPLEAMHVIENEVKFALPEILKDLHEDIEDETIEVFMKNLPKVIYI